MSRKVLTGSLCFLDVETTGFGPFNRIAKKKRVNTFGLTIPGVDYSQGGETVTFEPHQEIVEICAIIIDTDGSHRNFYRKVHPKRPEVMSSWAKKHGVYDAKKWRNEAIDAETMIDEFFSFIAPGGKGSDHLITAHGVFFDRKMIEACALEHGRKVPYMRTFCTIQLALMALGPCGLRSTKLDHLRELFGIQKTDAHTAQGDVRDTIAIFKLLQGIIDEGAQGRAAWTERLESWYAQNWGFRST